AQATLSGWAATATSTTRALAASPRSWPAPATITFAPSRTDLIGRSDRSRCRQLIEITLSCARGDAGADIPPSQSGASKEESGYRGGAPGGTSGGCTQRTATAILFAEGNGNESRDEKAPGRAGHHANPLWPRLSHQELL